MLAFKGTTTSLKLSDIVSDKERADGALKGASTSTHPELASHSAVHVHICNEILDDPSPKDNKQILDDVVVITTAGRRALYGFTFANRMELMMRRAESGEGKGKE